MQPQAQIERPEKGKKAHPAPKPRRAANAAANSVWRRLSHPAEEDLACIEDHGKAGRPVVRITKEESELWKRAEQFADEGEISLALALFAAAVSLPERDETAKKLIGPFDNENGTTSEFHALQGLAMRLLLEYGVKDELQTNRFIFAQLPEIMVAVPSN